jgi:RNA polymerase sigma-70 factor (ECF subfamily)
VRPKLTEHPSPDDGELVDRMRAGDEAAFEAFFDMYYPRLYRFALSRVGRPDAAEDIAQSAIVTSIRKIATWRGEAALFTWLCTLGRHEISAYCRRHNFEEVNVADDIPEIRMKLERLSAPGAGPLETLEQQERFHFVQLTLDYLPSRYGDLLDWKYIQGLSMQQIAERLNITPKAVEGMLTRARQAFRDGYATLTGVEP